MGQFLGKTKISRRCFSLGRTFQFVGQVTFPDIWQSDEANVKPTNNEKPFLLHHPSFLGWTCFCSIPYWAFNGNEFVILDLGN
jgi:hypothetical protein